MSKRWRIHEETLAEIAATVAWYETQRQGLGLEFLAELRSTLATLRAAPAAVATFGRVRNGNWLGLAILAALVVCEGAGACAPASAGSASEACGNQQEPCATTGGIGGIFPLTSLPHGDCSGASLCQMAIDPCPNERAHVGSERVDAYGCACVSGQWACTMCFQGLSLCAETPDGAPTIPPPDAGHGAVDAADAGDGGLE